MARRTCWAWMLLGWAATVAAEPAVGKADPRREARRTPIVRVFEAAKESVVNISTAQIIQVRDPFDVFERLFDDPFERSLQPRARRFKTTAVGSGFVIHASGYIVTNAHVVARTAERKVLFADGRAFDAEIVAQDGEHDLAVLKIEADAPLRPIPFGRSDDLMIGETAIAIGNPLGLENTLTVGVVSAVNRQLTIDDRIVYDGLIQTDASINPGNSGGPLLNILGELIGVNTAIRGDAQNIGFAIPVDRLSKALPELLAVERRYRVETGLAVSASQPPVIESIAAGSSAEKAGLRVGDVLRGLEGSPIVKSVDFWIGLIGRRPGDRLRLDVERDGRPLQVRLVLAEKPRPNGVELARARLGVELQPMSPALARKLGIPEARGLVISKVLPGGPAAETGLEPTDVLIELGPYQTTSVDDLGLLLESIRPDSVVRVGVLRLARQGIFRLRAALRVR